MRILYVIDSMAKDGAESQLLKTLNRLPPERYQATVVLTRTADGRTSELADTPCVQDIIPLTTDGRGMRGLLEKTFALAGTINALKPDIVHAWLWYSNLLAGLGRLARLWRRTPFIVSQRGDYHARYSRFRLWVTERCIYAPADLLLTNAAPIGQRLRERYPNKNIDDIPNLLELPEQHWTPPNTPNSEDRLILQVGRFAPEKGHRYLIAALNRLKKEGIAWRCRFLGEGEREAELRSLAARHGLSEQVEFPGFCESVFSQLRTADVFVLPSLHESSPNALIEAMGLGMPCIASDVGGVPDLIQHAENGLLVPPKDDAALGAAVKQILTHPDLAERLGRNARTTIRQRFNNERTMHQLTEHYHRLATPQASR